MRNFFFLVVMVLPFGVVVAQNSFQEAFLNAPRPSIENIRIAMEDELGNSNQLPISIFKGKTSGPVFTIVAGVHGYEYPPIMTVQALIQEIDIDALAGTIIFIPVANQGSFYARTPFLNPQDNINLNNAFPGEARGSVTQQLASFITRNIVPVTDVFLDIHGGDACEDLIPFVCYYNNKNAPTETQRAKELSERSGFSHVVSYPYTISATEPAKYAFKQAVQDGKVGLSIECGRLGNVHQQEVNLIKNGVYNMLADMRMYGKAKDAQADIISLNDQTYIRSTSKGIFYSELKAGDSVAEGQVVGYTTDVFGSKQNQYLAPKSGIILYMLATPPINEGDTIMCISSFNEANEKP